MIQPQTLAQTGNSTNKHFKLFGVSESKVGKTTYFACSSLGALPEQKFGLVSDPSCLHVISFDEGAIDGLKDFIEKQCKRPDCLSMTVWNMAPIVRDAVLGNGYDSSIYNNVMAILGEINKRANAQPDKVFAVLFASFTGMGMGIKNALAGKPEAGSDGKIKSSGMNQTKWDVLNASFVAIRTEAHRDNKHVFWEGHIQKKFVILEEGDKPPPQGQSRTEETVGVPGNEGKNWDVNVGEISRLTRESNTYKIKDANGKEISTGIDKVYMNTQPSADFISGGRSFTTGLNAKEYDLALAAQKLGKRVGGYTKP